MNQKQDFKVTVLIAVYNAEKFITKAVECALEQEETGEVILIEDASPDNCLEICRQLAVQYPRVKLIQHPDKKNHGAPASWNLGIQESSFDYIAISGADDFYLPERFKKDKEIFLRDPSVDGVYNAIDPVALDDIGGLRMESTLWKGISQRRTMDKNYLPEELFENLGPIGNGGFFCLNGVTVKKKTFDKTGLLDPTLRLSQDTDICIKMAAICKMKPGELFKPVALYGVHENNRSHNNDKLTANRPNLFYNLYKWGRKNKLSKSRIFLLWERFYQYNLIVNKPDRKKQIRMLLKEGMKNPSLFTARFFLKQLPILHKIIA